MLHVLKPCPTYFYTPTPTTHVACGPCCIPDAAPCLLPLSISSLPPSCVPVPMGGFLDFPHWLFHAAQSLVLWAAVPKFYEMSESSLPL